MSSEYKTLHTEEEPGYSDISVLEPELRKGVERAELTEPGLWARATDSDASPEIMFPLKDGFDQTGWDSKQERRLAADQAALAIMPLENGQGGTHNQTVARLRGELANGLSESEHEDPAAATRAAHALEDYREFQKGSDPGHLLEMLNEPTARDRLLALAEAHTGREHRYNGEAAQAVAEAAAAPLKALADARPESQELQDIARAAERSWFKAMAGSTSNPGMQDRPDWMEREAVKNIQSLTGIMERGEGTVHVPESYRMPEPNSNSLEDTLICAYELRRIGEGGFTTQHLMKGAGRELISDIEELAWHAVRQGEETSEAAQNAAQNLKSLQYLLRPIDSEYWPLHDSPHERRAQHAQYQANAYMEFPQQIAGMMADDGNGAADDAHHLVTAIREGLAANLNTALASGQPADYRQAHQHAVETARAATETVVAMEDDYPGLGTPASHSPRLPGRLTQEGGEGSEEWLNAARSYIVQATAACNHPDITAATEIRDTALSLTNMAKDALEREQWRSAGQMLRALDTVIATPETNR